LPLLCLVFHTLLSLALRLFPFLCLAHVALLYKPLLFLAPLACIGSARLGLARHGSARFGSAWLGSVRIGSDQLGLAMLCYATPCLVLLYFALLCFALLCRTGNRHKAEGRGFAMSVYHFAGWRTAQSSPLSSTIVLLKFEMTVMNRGGSGHRPDTELAADDGALSGGVYGHSHAPVKGGLFMFQGRLKSYQQQQRI
jgi:hypothetical protein